MILRREIALAIFFCMSIAIAIAPAALAATYGGSTYGSCAYQTGCPAPSAVTPAPSAVAPAPPGNAVPDANPDVTIVASDIDDDGNNEQAIDADGNPANGYEKFVDSDGSSLVLAQIDGENSGKTSFIIDANGDGVPDVYWSPDNQYTASVRVDERNGSIFWVFINAAHQLESYLAGHTALATPVSQGVANDNNRITSGSFGGVIYKEVGQLAKKVPVVVAYSFPYLLLLLLLLLIGRLLLQTRREFTRMRIIVSTTEREKELVLEKQNFLMLASHYLRTPITIIKGNIELAQSLKTIPEKELAPLNTSAVAIHAEIESLLEKITNDERLHRIVETGSGSVQAKAMWLSPFVLVPLGGLVLVGGFINFVFVDFRVTQPRVIDFLVQVVLVVILGQWFVSSFRKRHINKQNRLDRQKVLDEERSLDEARSNFIETATQALSNKVASSDQQLEMLTEAGYDTSRFRTGFDQLKDTLNKFNFASSLRAALVEIDKQQIDSTEIVTSVTRRAAQKAEARKVTLLPKAEGGMFTQNQNLLNTVLDSLADNAIKYSPEGSEVILSQGVEGSSIYFSVRDSGPGMTKEQLDVLFKPFSRAESVETFNTEGLGFSLYLDRLIAHYLGGDITIRSTPNKSTVAQLSIPRA